MEKTIDFLTFQQKFKAIIQKSTGDHNVSVRCLGSTILINVRASSQVILERIFEPLQSCQPTWKVKARGWHDIFVENHTLDYNQLLNLINSPWQK